MNSPYAESYLAVVERTAVGPSFWMSLMVGDHPSRSESLRTLPGDMPATLVLLGESAPTIVY